MINEGVVEFKIEELQPGWLFYLWKFRISFFLIYGAIVGMAGWVSAEVVYGRTSYSLSYGLTGTLTFLLFIWIASTYSLSINTLLFPSVTLNGILLYWINRILDTYGLGYMSTGNSLVFGVEYIITQGDLVPTLLCGLVFGGVLGLTAGWTWFFSKHTSTTFNTLEQIDKIQQVKLIRFPSTLQNIKKFIKWIGLGLISGALCGVCLGVVLGLFFSIGICLAFGLAMGLSLGLNKNENPVLDSNIPGQHTAYAVQASLLIAPIFSTASMLVFVQVFFLAEQFGFHDISFFSLPFFYHLYILISFSCVIFTGADIVFIHYMLRLLLWQEGQLPFRLVSWLEDLHQRKLLQRVGGSYHFIHKRLQEYLAQDTYSNSTTH
ncbi:MAG: hypothetical protein D3908_07590 [Candidatus Electrothrix sp. AUS4]|nr:hypothetical protein [Candidatus Electrothrix sp. AUS4]